MTSQRIGYGRVSTQDQNTDDQKDALTKAGVDRIFLEKYTGTKASRPEFDKLKDILRAGDTLIVTRLDRLGRSTKDLLEVGTWLRENGIDLKATEQPIDTSTAEGRMFYTILSAFAEFEHDLIVARTKDGLAAARARGHKGGRKAKLTPRQITGLKTRYNAGETVQALADSFAVSRPTIYRALEAS